jgi:Protein of unknown function (DUF3618)
VDEAAGQGGQAVERGQQQRSPEEIRRDIEQTRGELGDTVEALAQKADVKTQAKERLDAARQTAREKKEEFVGRAKTSTPEGASAGAQQLKSKAQENPLPFAVGGALFLGFLLGRRSGR